MSSSFLRVSNVAKTYRDNGESVAVLSSLSFELERGKLATLCGPSGSGKTTLLSVIGGLDFPDSGEVWLENTRIDSCDEETRASLRARDVGIVFQNPNLVSYLTALENVLLPSLFVSGEENEFSWKRRALELLETLGLSEKSEKYPPKLSEGERKRVSIARALVTRPKLILADEPTSNLDFENGQRVMRLLRSKVRENEAAALISTHDEHLAREYSDLRFRIRFGKLHEEESRQVILNGGDSLREALLV